MTSPGKLFGLFIAASKILMGQASPEQMYANGLRQLAAQENSSGLLTMQALVRAHPEFDRGYYGVVNAYNALRRLPEARAYFDSLPSPHACLGLVETDLARQDWLGAEQAGARCSGQIPDSLPAFRLWAIAATSNKTLPVLLQKLESGQSNPPRPALDWAIGWVAQLLSRTDKSQRANATLHLRRAAATLPDQDGSDEALYFLYRNHEQYPEAAAAMERLLARAKLRGDEDWIDRASGRLAVLYVDLRDYDAASRHLETALGFDAQFQRPRAQIMHLTTLGDLRFAQARWAEAASEYERALQVEAGEQSADARAVLYIKIGRVHRERGRFQDSIVALGKAETLLRGYAPAMMVAYASTGLARAYAELGDSTRATEIALRAASDVAAVDPGWTKGRLLDDLAATFRNLGQPAKALQLWGEAAGQASGARDALGELRAQLRRAETLMTLNRITDAAVAMKPAMALLASVSSPAAQAEYHLVWGKLCARSGDPVNARSSLDTAMALSTESGAPLLLSRVLQASADLLLQQGEFENALTQRRKAIAILEGLRADLFQPDDRAYFLAHRITLYRELTSQLLNMHRNEAAFEVAEQGRARAYLDLMLGETAGEGNTGQPERQHLAIAQLRLLALRAQPQNSPAALRAAERELEEAATRYQQSPSAYVEGERGLPAAATIELRSLQRSLRRDVLVLHYALLDEPVVFALSSDAFTTHRLPTPRLLESRVKRLRTLLSQQPQRLMETALVEAARELYATLIGPVASRLNGKKELVVIADGILHYVPFAALISGQPPSGSRSLLGQPFLIRRVAIRYAPSASVLAALETRPHVSHTDWSLLALGDPRFYLASTSAAPAAELRSSSNEFPHLPHSRAEIHQLAKLYPPSRRLLLSAESATEARLRASPELKAYRVLHFAVHGLLNETRPELSGLVLSRDKHSEPGDGLLQSYEVLRLRLSADLVVLSACESGLGQPVRGEGLLGLTRAFLAAGASSVVASLWRVDDASTARLMVDLHRNLRDPSVNRAEALRRAQIALASSSAWNHPYYWAAFTLTGATR